MWGLYSDFVGIMWGLHGNDMGPLYRYSNLKLVLGLGLGLYHLISTTVNIVDTRAISSMVG